ncbi:MAG: nucleotide exchange factor GrpE [Acidobacteriota bacterium]
MEERDPIENNPGEDTDEELVVTEDRKEQTNEEAVEQRLSADAEALQELNNKYLRLYAEFDNYKKRVNKDKEELVRYGNESLLYALLPAIDNLELALKHGACDPKTGVVQGVEITLKELQRTLEKFGLTRIGAVGKKFDPAVHHAMTQVERADMKEKMVAEELRAGYRYHDKVLRPSLVAVSVKPKTTAEAESEDSTQKAQCNTEENIEEE